MSDWSMLGASERGSRAVRGAVALAAALAAGCGAAPARVGATPGATALVVANRVGPPCEVVSVVVRVDSDLVRLQPAPPPSGSPERVGELSVAPGDHVVAARASARCKRAGQVETVVVGAQQPLRLEPHAAADRVVTVTLTSSSSDARDGIAVTLAARGGLLVPERGVSDREAVCAGVRETRKALCRAEADHAIALGRNDVAWALCVRDQLGALRAAADLYDTVQARADEEAEALARARIDELTGRVERCAAGAVYSLHAGATAP